MLAVEEATEELRALAIVAFGVDGEHLLSALARDMLDVRI